MEKCDGWDGATAAFRGQISGQKGVMGAIPATKLAGATMPSWQADRGTFTWASRSPAWLVDTLVAALIIAITFGARIFIE